MGLEEEEEVEKKDQNLEKGRAPSAPSYLVLKTFSFLLRTSLASTVINSLSFGLNTELS